MDLKDITPGPQTFGLLIKWIYTDYHVSPEMFLSNANASTQIAGFLKPADRLDLLGQFDSLVKNMSDFLISDRSLLEPHHVRQAVELPSGHDVRLSVAKACLRPYMESIKKSKEFKLKVELDAFASDLLNIFGQLLPTMLKTVDWADVVELLRSKNTLLDTVVIHDSGHPHETN